jgi:hypothetical protein
MSEWSGLDQVVKEPSSNSTTSGNVNTPRKRGRPAKKVESLPKEVASSPTDTSVKATDPTEIPQDLSEPISFVSSTESNSSESMDSILSLSGYVNSGYPMITEELLSKLKPLVLVKLKFLSRSKGTTLEETIRQCALFLTTNGATWLDREPLTDALEFYSLNFIIVTPKDLEE